MPLPELSQIVSSLDTERVEPRLYPAADCWDDSSQGGFLAPGERLVDIVVQDYETLQRLGVDYKEMAAIASDILSTPQSKGFLASLFSGDIFRKKVSPYDSRVFESSHIGSMGLQSCPWGCRMGVNGYSTAGSGQIYFNQKVNGVVRQPLMEEYAAAFLGRDKKKFSEWKQEIGITFGDTERILYLSCFTVVTDLTPHLISKHFFFQGDASFRTDPAKLLEVYTSGRK